MQPRCRFVEQKEAALFCDLCRGDAAARGLCQVTRQLQALRFAARQRGHGLAEAHILEAHVGQRRQCKLHIAQSLEEVDRFGDRHPEDGVDRGAPAEVFDFDFAHLRPKTAAIAIGAPNIDVGEKLHLNVLETCTSAGRAAPVAAIEAECTRRIAALARKRRLREKLADRIERANVAGRIGPRCLADGRLVDHDHVRKLFRAQDAAEGTWRLGRLAHDLEQARVEHILDQGGFARAGYAGDADETAQRDLDRDVAQVIGGCAFEQQARGRRCDGQRSGRLDLDEPPHVLAGQGACLAQRVGRSIEHDLPATFAGPRAHVDDAVGGDHHLGIVLDDHQRVAGIAQAVHHPDHAMDIARVQPDRRLIKHEECIDQRCAKRRGQVDALDLAARQRSALPVKREVTQPDVAEEFQARANLGEHQIHRGIHQCAFEGQVVDERTQV